MVISLNQSKKDKKIEKVLMSIRLGYDKLEEIESELETIRRKRDTIFSE